MARNGSGTYNLPTPQNPVVGSTLISSANHNTTMLDVAAALSASIANDGQTTIYADIPFNTHKITGLAPGSTSTDAANVSQITSALNFTQAGTGASVRTVQNKIAETISVKDYGAFGDGTSHPLIDRFATLALAQAVYPHATSLTDESDWAATQAAVNYAETLTGTVNLLTKTGVEIRFPRGEFMFNKTITVLADGIGFTGDSGKGTLLKATGNIAIFTVGDPAYLVRARHGSFSNLCLVGVDVTATGTIGIRLNRTTNVRIFDCQAFNLYITVDSFASSSTMISNCYFTQFSRTTNAALTTIRHQGLDLSSSGIFYSPGGGWHISNCEFHGNSVDTSLCNTHLLINTIDGLYVNATHFLFAVRGLAIEPTGLAANNCVTDVYFDGGCYFDEPHTVSSYNVVIGGTINYVDTNRPGVYQNIRFCNCFFRGSTAAVNNVVVSIIDGGAFTTNNRKIENIAFESCTFQDSKGCGLVVQGTASSRLEVYQVSVDHCFFTRQNTGTASTVTGINAECENITITDNIFDADTIATERNVSINMSLSASTNPALLLSSNDFSRSNCTDVPIQYTDIAGALTNISNNILPGHGQEVDQLYKITTTNAAPAIIWSQVIDTAGQVGIVETRTIGSNSTAAQRARYLHRCHFFRPNAGTTVATVTELFGEKVMDSVVSVMLSTLTGPAWVASTGYSGGDLITNAGHVYYVLNGGTSGTSAPTFTSGTAANGTTTLGYLAVTAANTLALFVAGTAATTVNWCTDIEFMCVP